MPSFGKRRRRGRAQDKQLLLKGGCGHSFSSGVDLLLDVWSAHASTDDRRRRANRSRLSCLRKKRLRSPSQVDRNTNPTGVQHVELSELPTDYMVTDDTPLVLHGQFGWHTAGKRTGADCAFDFGRCGDPRRMARLSNRGRLTASSLPSRKTPETISQTPPRSEGDDSDGCVYSTCDMTFNGTGSLEVTGLYQDALRS